MIMTRNLSGTVCLLLTNLSKGGAAQGKFKGLKVDGFYILIFKPAVSGLFEPPYVHTGNSHRESRLYFVLSSGIRGVLQGLLDVQI